MCGIAGIIQREPLCHKEQVHQMIDVLAHRRLAIIDTSEAAAQPLHYTPPSGFLHRYTIVYNGEIYNYPELREQLEKEGYSFHTRSDTEVIVAAYDHWDEDCLIRFDGMFAFAIWDEEEKELFAARDRFGEKPFCYHFEKGVISFASEMKALWAAGINRTVNLKMLFNYITIGYVDNPERPEETFYEHVYRFPPASSLFFYPATGELIIDQYWELSVEENNKISDEEAVEQFSLLLSTSLQRRLRSDMPVGTSLSGGLDSSAIAALINSTNNRSFSQHCFTAVFPGFEKDETGFSKLIAGKFDLHQHMVNVAGEDLIHDWKTFC